MIFADSSFFIGLVDKKDKWHDQALALSESINEEMMVSDLVISESVTLAGSRSGGKTGQKLYLFFVDNCHIEYVDEDILREGMDVFLRYDGKLSIPDSVSVVLMRRMGISRIASFDSDFDRVDGIRRVG
ncbi:MAG: PIN domain-containing protein [Thermoplasmata archaeon]